MVKKREASPPPNWRDPLSYEYTLSLSNRGWAWEFLRRNPKFRKLVRHLKPGSVRIGKPGDTVRIVTALGVLQPLKDWGVLFF